MQVLRIVSNVQVADPAVVAGFYEQMFGFDRAMDQGWIVTMAGAGSQGLQVTLAQDGGSGTDLPALSVEVDDLDAALERASQLGITPEYGPVTEPWGVRRFYIRDPAGTLLNILSHTE